MHAPTAAIFALPAATSRSSSAWSRGFKRIAVSAGRYSALRSRALPALDSRVRFRTVVPERYCRGASPAEAAACSAEGNAAGPGISARMAWAVVAPTPGMLSNNAWSARSFAEAATRASAWSCRRSASLTVRVIDSRAAAVRPGAASRPFARGQDAEVVAAAHQGLQFLSFGRGRLPGGGPLALGVL